MSELRKRMIQDLELAGLAEGTKRIYVQAVRQLAGYYTISPDQLTEQQVQDYILYVRDDLGVAKGTFATLLAGPTFCATLLTRPEIPAAAKRPLPEITPKPLT